MAVREKTCKDCVHYYTCSTLFIRKCNSEEMHNIKICRHFMNKERTVYFPDDIGSKTVYVLGVPCDKCDYSNKVMSGENLEEFINACDKCNRYEIVKTTLAYELLGDMGKMVFFTGEDAEKALEELKNG